MAGHFSKGFGLAAFLSITIVALAGGCNHPQRSTPEDTTAVSNEVSNALVGKQITIRGKYSTRGKFGACVLLDNHQVVYLVPMRSPMWKEPYSEMEGKLVVATGTLRFYHDPNTTSGASTVARAVDHYYFEVENAQLQFISH